MGLSIFFHHTKIAFDGDKNNIKDFEEFTEKVDNLAKETFSKKVEKLLYPLREAWANLQTNDYWRNTYNERYFTFVEKLRPMIAKNYDFKIYPYTKGVLDFPELEVLVKKEVDEACEEYDVYFRKVNFILAYYQNIGKMVDESYAFTDADDIDDLIGRCKRVLKDHELAERLLPTRDGFYFGNTIYGEEYFYDVKDCLKEMKKYRKLLKDGVTGYVIFS